jgi:hypothetical protein
MAIRKQDLLPTTDNQKASHFGKLESRSDVKNEPGNALLQSMIYKKKTAEVLLSAVLAP